MGRAERLITENLGLWSAAVKTKTSAGRSSSQKRELYGISKLRDLILDLAVRGMLVQQDLNDEPASKYLERTAAAKIKLLKDKKIKKQRPLAKIETDSLEFRLPRGWQWERLGNLVEMYNGRAFKSTEWRTEGLPIVRIQNLNDNKADFNYFQGELSDSNRISNGTFLISWSGTPGTSFGAFIWERGPAALNQHINKCEFHSNEVNLDFMRLAVNGQMNHFISKAQGGVGLKHVTKGTLNNAILGIPPLAEQHRIVAKVDELMALCDQLEEEQENNLETHETLVSMFLNALTSAAADAAQFANAWQLIKDNFDILFTTESSVDQLKQTILQLAVMGKLVPQDPGDEPADELLKKITKEKDSLAKSKMIGKQKQFNEVCTQDVPYPLPRNWTWCRLGQTGICFTGKTPKTSNSTNFGGSIQFIGPGQITQSGKFLEAEKTITESGLGESTEAVPGDILMVCIGGSIGKSAITDKRLAFNQQINSLRPIGLNAKYLNLAMTTDRFFQSVVENSTGSATPIINRTKWEMLLVPIPPLEEQHRIVAKGDELIALCDQLKAKLTQAQETQLTLADSIVEQAIHSPA